MQGLEVALSRVDQLAGARVEFLQNVLQLKDRKSIFSWFFFQVASFASWLVCVCVCVLVPQKKPKNERQKRDTNGGRLALKKLSSSFVFAVPKKLRENGAPLHVGFFFFRIRFHFCRRPLLGCTVVVFLVFCFALGLKRRKTRNVSKLEKKKQN